ncbi:ABC transporter permease [Alkaliphilus transvaalensis]|uniref:ABC transporter permease n=1 Tax=Alkaliphilus transvaalensis TaxID=114628 RepID=UPI00047BE064|nr:ABC transporter permease [Alkaliphilus transvaalensis]
MNPIFGLWKKRMIYFTKLYYKFIAFQFDAVITLYTVALIALLGLAYFPYIDEYINLLSVNPYFKILQIITLIVLLSGEIKGYLKGADEVYLSPMNVSGKEFVSYSEKLNLTLAIVGWSLFVGLLYLLNPVIKVGERVDFGYFYILGLQIKVLYMVIKFILYQRYKTGFKRIMKYPIKGTYWVLSYVFVSRWFEGTSWGISNLAIIFSLIILLLAFYYIKNKTVIKWIPWITDEANERARILATLLGEPPREKLSSKRRTPKTFSGRKFEPFSKVGGLLLLYFRLLFRGKGNIQYIFQISTVIFIIFLLETEMWFITIGIFFITFLLSYYMVSIWNQLIEDVWIKIYPFSLKEKSRAFQLGPFIGLMPLLLLISLIYFITNKVLIHPVIDSIVLFVWVYIVISFRTTMVMTKIKG